MGILRILHRFCAFVGRTESAIPCRIQLTAMFCLAALGVTACARELPGERVPKTGLYFPSSLLSSEDSALFYVVSSNFDQRFVAGWVSTYNVDLWAQAVESGEKGMAALATAQVAQLKVPSLGGSIEFSPNGKKVVMGARGERPVTFFEVQEGLLSCGDADNDKGLSDELSRTDCDPNHMFLLNESVPGAIEFVSLNLRPFVDAYAAAFVDDERVAVGFLGTEYIAILTANREGIFEPSAGAVLQDPGVDAVSTLSRWTTAQDGQTRLVATTRSSGVQGFSPLGAVLSMTMDDVRAGAVSADEPIPYQRRTLPARNLVAPVFSADGALVYVLSDSPSALFVLDARLSPVGKDDEGVQLLQPRFSTMSSIPLPGRPTGIASRDKSDGLELVVTAFEDDALYVISTAGATAFVQRVFSPICQGPFQPRIVNSAQGDRQFVVVSCFYESTLVLLDISSGDVSGYFVLGGE